MGVTWLTEQTQEEWKEQVSDLLKREGKGGGGGRGGTGRGRRRKGKEKQIKKRINQNNEEKG